MKSQINTTINTLVWPLYFSQLQNSRETPVLGLFSSFKYLSTYYRISGGLPLQNFHFQGCALPGHLGGHRFICSASGLHLQCSPHSPPEFPARLKTATPRLSSPSDIILDLVTSGVWAKSISSILSHLDPGLQQGRMTTRQRYTSNPCEWCKCEILINPGFFRYGTLTTSAYMCSSS